MLVQDDVGHILGVPVVGVEVVACVGEVGVCVGAKVLDHTMESIAISLV